jgi:Domain of unknown function (DUF1844)
MPEEPEEGFIVRDRRRAYLEETETEEVEPSSEPIIPPTPAPVAPSVPPAAPIQPSAPPAAPVQPSAPSRPTPQFGFPGVAPIAPPPPPGFGGFGPPQGQQQGFGMPQGMPAEMQQETMAGPEMSEGDPNEVPDVFSLLIVFLNELFHQAILRLGLAPNPTTGELEPDLGQAKVAIDTLAFVAKQLEPVIPPEERMPLQSRIQDLQRHYMAVVQKLQETHPNMGPMGGLGNPSGRGGII